MEENEIDKFKARIVVRGFAQNNIDYENIYSPVAKITTIGTLLSLGNQLSYYFLQLDVKCAFLNGILKSPVYIYYPKGMLPYPGKILKLKKSVYGLKESSRCWNNEINSFLLEIGFVRSENDFCLYFKVSNNERIYLLLYVDDIILAGPSLSSLNEIISKLMNRFEMKNKGQLNHFLGLEIKYNREEGILNISQTKYIKTILAKFDMENCKGVKTPIDKRLKLNICPGNNLTNKPFRQLVGCLMYLMVGSLPDICFAMNYFSSLTATDESWKHLTRMLRYLKTTMYEGLEYKRIDTLNFICYVDADWGSNLQDRKSVSGFLFK